MIIFLFFVLFFMSLSYTLVIVFLYRLATDKDIRKYGWTVSILIGFLWTITLMCWIFK